MCSSLASDDGFISLSRTLTQMLDAVVMGSAFVELTPTKMKVSLSEVGSFNLGVGGSAANISVALSRLGTNVGLISAVGNDDLGAYVLGALGSDRVNTSRVKRVTGSRTGLSLYSVDSRGTKTYHFYRFPGYSAPESTLSLKDLDRKYVSSAKALVLGEASVRQRPSRDLAEAAVRIAKSQGSLVLYDPNFRSSLWSNKDEAAEITRRFVSLASIVTPNAREALLITGRRSVESAIEDLMKLCGGVVAVKQADEGCTVGTQHEITRFPAFRIHAVDDTGAGDAFAAGLLAGMLRGLRTPDAAVLASAVAALKVSALGTAQAMPTLKAVKRFLHLKKVTIPML